MAQTLVRAPERIFFREREKIQRNLEGLQIGAQKIIALQKAKFEIVETKVKSHDPKRILARGFAYATAAGKGLVKSKSEVQSGDEILMHFADGNVSVVAK